MTSTVGNSFPIKAALSCGFSLIQQFSQNPKNSLIEHSLHLHFMSFPSGLFSIVYSIYPFYIFIQTLSTCHATYGNRTHCHGLICPLFPRGQQSFVGDRPTVPVDKTDKPLVRQHVQMCLRRVKSDLRLMSLSGGPALQVGIRATCAAGWEASDYFF